MLADKLLEVAIDHFGRLGFEGASTRAIARDSATAMSSITYHFGGKEQLYLAAADHIGRCIAEMQAPALGAARSVGAGNRDAAMTAVLNVLDSMAQMMLRPESESWARFIIREQQAPTAAFDAIYENVMKGIADTFIGLLGAVRPDLDEKERRATAILLVGQAMILRAGRASVCRILDVKQLDEMAQKLLRARLRANAMCILAEKHR